eukprot:TRINITY_DN311_c0_g1_i2.p1 TRINITY_DN311_c0_g1~~TRINITY_DN311_c0_g1_i2.p1  ORF type:complete len:265 (+),score=38.99 TRINITY_DN311_c0_g1_i2:217-1011(+)
MAVYRLSWALCALLLVVAVVADEPETKTVSSVGANKEAELEKNYAASLHINPDVTEKITKKSCYDCLSMFFRTQAASSLPYFLRNKCPDFEASKRASLCRSLTNFLIMNGLMPGGEACTGVQRCNKGILKEMLKNGELKELENLVGWGDARAGKLGIWGRYGAPKDGQTGDYRHCIDDCSKISIKVCILPFRVIPCLSLLLSYPCLRSPHTPPPSSSRHITSRVSLLTTCAVLRELPAFRTTYVPSSLTVMTVPPVSWSVTTCA